MLTHNYRSIHDTAESFGAALGTNTADSWGEEHDTMQDGTNLRSAMLNGSGDCGLGIDAADSAKGGEHLAAYDTLPCPPPDSGETTQ